MRGLSIDIPPAPRDGLTSITGLSAGNRLVGDGFGGGGGGGGGTGNYLITSTSDKMITNTGAKLIWG